MESNTKPFDCVEMKRRGAALVYEKLKGMSEEQEIEYWRKRTEEMRAEQTRARLARTGRG